MSRPRIVVTGMGVVSPYGLGVETLWKNLVAGVDAVGEVKRLPAEGYRVRQGGEFKGDVTQLAECASGDLATRFLITAAGEAAEQAGLTPENGARAGVVLATNFAQIEQGEKLIRMLAGGQACDERLMEAFRMESAAVEVGRRFGLGGIVSVLSLSCSSGNAAIGAAIETIRHGRADIVLTGAYDAITEYAWAGLVALHTMSPTGIRPFDAGRDGTIFGEGSGCLVIETEESARKRGAKVLAEVAGYATNNNAFHLTAPEKDGKSIARAMARALADAGVEPGQVDYVNAHGTATKYNDATETLAIKEVLGKRAHEIPVNSIKSMIGHLMGSASAVEAIATVKTLQTGIVPPTIHYEKPDPECDLDCVPNRAREYQIRTAVNNSSGLGGCNSMVVLRKAAI